MKSLANKTVLVALAMALWEIPSMAATGELSTVSVIPAADKDTHRATAATAPAPLYALTRLDAQTLAVQAMTDQELKAVEGGWAVVVSLMNCQTTGGSKSVTNFQPEVYVEEMSKQPSSGWAN